MIQLNTKTFLLEKVDSGERNVITHQAVKVDSSDHSSGLVLATCRRDEEAPQVVRNCKPRPRQSPPGFSASQCTSVSDKRRQSTPDSKRARLRDSGGEDGSARRRRMGGRAQSLTTDQTTVVFVKWTNNRGVI